MIQKSKDEKKVRQSMGDPVCALYHGTSGDELGWSFGYVMEGEHGWFPRQEAGGRRQEAGGRRRQEAGGRRQEAGGRRQEARGRRQEAGGKRQ